jgi:hypothetical protein
MNGRASFGDLFVHRRLIEIRREVEEADVLAAVVSALVQLDALDGMRRDREAMELWEAEHGRSSPLIFKWRAMIDANYDQNVAIPELRNELDERLRAAAVA